MAKKAKKVVKRRAKRKGPAAKVIAEADALAVLLADAPVEPGVLAPPAYIAGPKRMATWRVWSDVTGLLAERGMLDRLDKGVLAIYCVYMAEFVAANEDVRVRGFTTRVKTVSGDHMLRENPAVSIRDTAAKMILDISRREGFTQLDRAMLMRAQKGADMPADLFAQVVPAAADVEEDIDPEAAGWAKLLDPEQPPAKPN